MSGDYLALTPAELRKEADRRELVERARDIAERRAARNALVEALMALDPSMVHTARAARLLTGVVDALVKADDDEPGITNGDVHMLSFGTPTVPEHWWREATASHPKQDYPSILDRRRKRMISLWPAPKSGRGSNG